MLWRLIDGSPPSSLKSTDTSNSSPSAVPAATSMPWATRLENSASAGGPPNGRTAPIVKTVSSPRPGGNSPIKTPSAHARSFPKTPPASALRARTKASAVRSSSSNETDNRASTRGISGPPKGGMPSITSCNNSTLIASTDDLSRSMATRMSPSLLPSSIRKRRSILVAGSLTIEDCQSRTAPPLGSCLGINSA